MTITINGVTDEGDSMEWDIGWEMKSGDVETLLGTTRISANKVVDALDKFFKGKDNYMKKMTGIRVVPEEPIKPKRRKVLDK